MKVATVESKHLSHKTELLLPKLSCLSPVEDLRTLLEQPKAIVPYPVALWKFLKKGKQEIKIVGDEIC